MISFTKGLLRLVVVGSMAVVLAQPAVAQTADKLKCKGCVKSKQIKNNGIKSADIKDGNVTNADLGDNSVGASEIIDGSVGASEIADGALTNVDLLDEPGLEFNNRTGFGTSNDLSTTWADMQTLDVTHPASGFVVCTSMGFCDWNATLVPQNGCQVGWGTEAGNVAPPVNHFLIPLTAGVDGPLVDASALYTFEVSGAGTTTFRLKANIFTGTAGSVSYWNQSSACMYFPKRY